MKTCNNTFSQNLRLNAVLLLCAVGALLTAPHPALANSNITISSISFTSGAGPDNTYVAGDDIQVDVTFSAAVKVTGTPQLRLTIGSSDKAAKYTGGTTTTKLTFEYTVEAGDNDTNGISIGTSKFFFDTGSSIRDNTTSQTVLMNYSAITDQSSHKVDTTAPTVSSVSITSTSTNNYYKKDDKIQATVTFSENVTVDTQGGTPQLTLKVGDAEKTAAYESGSGSTGLVFAYTVAFGDTDTDGIEIEANTLGLNSGTIKDAVNHDATLTHSALGAQTSHRVDTTAPTVSSVVLTSAAKTYKANDKIQATVTFSEDVTVTGTPQLTLKIGDSDKKADYESGNGTAELVFSYTVASGDTDTDGIQIEANKLKNSGSSTIKDAAGNAATLTHDSVDDASLYKVDTTKPTVSQVTLTTGVRTKYKKGDKLHATVKFSESVTVDTTGGTPQLTLKIGDSDKKVNYTAGSPSTSLIFTYTIAAGDEDTDGIEIEANKLGLNGGTIKDAAGNAANLDHTAVATSALHKVDGVVPTVSSVAISSTATNNYYKKDDTIQVK